MKGYKLEARYNADKDLKYIVFDCDTVSKTPITSSWCASKCKNFGKCRFIRDIIEEERNLNMEEILVTEALRDYYIKNGGEYVDQVLTKEPTSGKMKIMYKVKIPKLNGGK